jgi:RNA polymerase sigma factor (sigma-70 family)
METLLAHIAYLSEREQEIIGLKFGGGLTNRKISNLLGLTENHVAVVLYRAIRKLRRSLAKSDTQIDATCKGER